MYIYHYSGDVLIRYIILSYYLQGKDNAQDVLDKKSFLASINGKTATVGQVLASIAGKFQPNPAYATA